MQTCKNSEIIVNNLNKVMSSVYKAGKTDIEKVTAVKCWGSTGCFD